MKSHLLATAATCAFLLPAARAQLLISEFLTNPSGIDSPFEYVELIAASDINFSLTPWSVVWTDGATANGWAEGGNVTYGFNINSGSVMRGDVVYVGGSSMAPAGAKLRTIDTLNQAGDGFGNPRNGVLGNGGANADGIGVFNVDISLVSASLRPVDAIFFGDGPGPGSTVVDGGASGYEVPVNDRYNGGKLQADSFVAPDPGGENGIATGTYDPQTGTWLTPRVWTTGPLTDGISGVGLVPIPEPSTTVILIGGVLFGAWILRRRR